MEKTVEIPEIAPVLLRDTIPLCGNTYITSESGTQDYIDNNCVIKWTDEKSIFSSFFRVNQAGALRLFLLYNSSVNSKIEAKINGQRFEIALAKSQKDTTVLLCELNHCETGYVRVDFRGLEKDSPNAQFAVPLSLVADGQASVNMTYIKSGNQTDRYWGQRGPYLVLWYSWPKTSVLPEMEVEWFYNEITVPEGMDPEGSYYEANGFSFGYFGIQVNSKTERRVIFSVWSPYKTDNPAEVPAEDKVILAKKGKDVYADEFGHEGSGGHSHWVYNWKTGETQRFLTRVRPVENGYTECTSWFYVPETFNWKLIARFLRPKTQSYYHNAYSFIECFNSNTGYLTRCAYYNNQWAYTTNGKWVEIVDAKYAQNIFYPDGDGMRKDYKGGCDEKGFFLQNCGFFDDFISDNVLLHRTPTNIPPRVNLMSLEE